MISGTRILTTDPVCSACSRRHPRLSEFGIRRARELGLTADDIADLQHEEEIVIHEARDQSPRLITGLDEFNLMGQGVTPEEIEALYAEQHDMVREAVESGFARGHSLDTIQTILDFEAELHEAAEAARLDAPTLKAVVTDAAKRQKNREKVAAWRARNRRHDNAQQSRRRRRNQQVTQ